MSDEDTTWEELVAATVTGVPIKVAGPLVMTLCELVPEDADGDLVADVARHLAVPLQFAQFVAESKAPWLYDYFRSAPETWACKAWPKEFYDRIAGERWTKRMREKFPAYEVKKLKELGLSKRFWFKLTRSGAGRIEDRFECYGVLHDNGWMDEYFHHYAWNGLVPGPQPEVVGCR